jgi:hypothetical protein
MHCLVCEYVLLIERVSVMQIVIFVTVLAGYTLFLHERLAFDVRASLGLSASIMLFDKCAGAPSQLIGLSSVERLLPAAVFAAAARG